MLMHCIPDESSATPYGPYNAAEVAATPLLVLVPLPAIVYIIPVDIVTLRTALLLLSAMYTLPILIQIVINIVQELSAYICKNYRINL